MSLTIQQALIFGKDFLKNYSDQPQLDCEILLMEILTINRVQLYRDHDRQLSTTEITKFKEFLQLRVQGFAIPHIINKVFFADLELKINKNVLIPRPETELLVQISKKNLVSDQKYAVIDLGTGCGNIAIALAIYNSSYQVYGIDQSPAAIALAKENAQHYQLQNVNFILSDWFSQIPQDLRFDAVISNPPYVAVDDPDIHNNVLLHEPRDALFAGKKGLDAIEKIILQAKQYLKLNSFILFEHGFKQGQQVRNLLLQHGYSDVETYRDINQHERATIGFFK